MTIIESPCSDPVTAMIRACETIVHPDLPATNKDMTNILIEEL